MFVPAVGECVRQFRLLERLGGGGMGEVFRAHDEKLDRDVALKFLTQLGRVTPQHADRLRREARSLAALSHPNVVTIFDLDEIDGLPYLVLEWVRGSDLTAVAGRQPLPLSRFFAVALPVAEALAAAHRQGIVHRDVKPANVLIAEDGGVKLLD
ncbi:MAG TPA: serine/threonine-protein kinase, partial [Thermoanaerobaculia bacterium]|nr:serine/threonine-protein kinase [Thermoanaerobaculia bacterium]